MQQIFTTNQLWLSGTPAELQTYLSSLPLEQLHLPLKLFLAKMLH